MSAEAQYLEHMGLNNYNLFQSVVFAIGNSVASRWPLHYSPACVSNLTPQIFQSICKAFLQP